VQMPLAHQPVTDQTDGDPLARRDISIGASRGSGDNPRRGNNA
jgi:hypothetical protein